MFSGYGGAEFGLKKAGIEYECVGYSEIDKGAIKCYKQNFNNVKNYGDCSEINTKDLPDFDLLTGGFPCQDVSIAGNRDLSKGRTNLYIEILRIAREKKPKYMLLENVKGLLSVEIEEGKLINKIIRDLEKIGYGVCWKVLNSKDYGIPQNRERIWFVCKLGGWNFMEFKFPEKKELKILLKDLLEKNIDKKYYLSEESIKKLQERNKRFNIKGNRFIKDSENTFSTLTTSITNNDSLIEMSEKTRDINKALAIANKLSNKSDKPVQLDLLHLQHGEIRPLSTYIPQDFDINRCLQSGEPKEVIIYKNKVRKLTPKECFRLMGFLNDEINLEGLSDNQKYKLAGNGWDINLVSKILKEMFRNQGIKP